MFFARAFVLTFLSLVLTLPASPQQTASPTIQSNPQALALLRNSLAALTGGQSITDVTLAGTARRIAGSDDEWGTASLKALSSGAARVDLNMPSGFRTEIANLTSPQPAGSWTGPDGVSHEMVYHNLLSEPAWFFPAFAIAHRLSTSSFISVYVGLETRNGQTVHHILASQTSPSKDPPLGPSFAHLTQIDFYLDVGSLLPTAITFNIHPDNDAGIDLPVEILFSGYQTINHAQVALHVQELLNNNLLLDLQCSNAQMNSGLATSLFNVQ